MLLLNGRIHVSHEVRLYRVGWIVREDRKPIWGRQDEAVVCCHVGRGHKESRNAYFDCGTATRLDNALTAHQTKQADGTLVHCPHEESTIIVRV